MENILRLCQISSEVSKLRRTKFVVSIFVFTLIFHYLIRSLSIISEFFKIYNSIVSK